MSHGENHLTLELYFNVNGIMTCKKLKNHKNSMHKGLINGVAVQPVICLRLRSISPQQQIYSWVLGEAILAQYLKAHSHDHINI